MKSIVLRCGPTGLCLRVAVATRWYERLCGLLGKPALRFDEALLIRPCNSIHTFGMRAAIDVAFIDRQNRVLSLKRQVQPMRLRGDWRAAAALEMAAGTIDRLSMTPRMTLWDVTEAQALI